MKHPYSRARLGLTASRRGASLELVAAVKPHVCACCGEAIVKGEVYYRETLATMRQGKWAFKGYAFHWDCWFAGGVVGVSRCRRHSDPFLSMEVSA